MCAITLIDPRLLDQFIKARLKCHGLCKTTQLDVYEQDRAVKKFAVITQLILLILIVQRAEAAEPIVKPVVGKKYYLGAKSGTIKNSVGSLKQNSNGFGVVGGYLVGSDFALELGYNNLGSMDEGMVKISALEFSAIANFPINEQFSLFGKLGMAKTTEAFGTLKISRLGPTYALGGAFNLNPAFSLRFGWDRYSFGGDRIDTSGVPIRVDEGSSDVYSVAGIFKF